MNKHQAIDPAGKVHTRNSASRIYTHTVVAHRNYQRELAEAQKAYNGRSHFDWYSKRAKGQIDRNQWENDEQYAAKVADAQAEAIKKLNGTTTLADYEAMLIAQQIAQVEKNKAAGAYEEWLNMGWCGRRDLAVKLAGSCDGWRINPRILEATMTSTKKKA